MTQLARTLSAAIALCLTAASPVYAAERGYIVTGFDRIKLEGPYEVTVTSGAGPSARAQGSAAGLDAVVVRVVGRTLVIQRDANAWGGYPGQDRGAVSLRVTVPALVAASLAGSGRLDIDAMRGASIDVSLAGSGRIAVAQLRGDNLTLGLNGSGGISASGTTAGADISLNGSGTVAASGLRASDAVVNVNGSGEVALTVDRAVKVQAIGSGNVSITGDPACTVRRIGSGTIRCGHDG